jgi:hypothetical protein
MRGFGIAKKPFLEGDGRIAQSVEQRTENPKRYFIPFDT